MSHHVYGPVPSRRLGRSLGVSLVPLKTCTYSCVYCQLGRTTDQTVERRSFFPPADILGEIGNALEVTGDVDHVTFIGDGEPTLSSDIGLLIGQVKERFDVPVAVVTNGSLFHDAQVREELMAADRVIPTLTTTDHKIWRRMHRPHGDLVLYAVIEGLVNFCQEYGGDLWLEVMLVHGLNDSDVSLKALRDSIQRIEPGRVDLLTPIRPPAEDWVEVPEPKRVLRAEELLGSSEAMLREADAPFNASDFGSCREAVLTICSRHPLRERTARDLCMRLNGEGAVEEMLADGEIHTVRWHGETYLLPHNLMRNAGT
ncbi:MAG: radical SAM protein [Thermoplasmata archaeon]|nr:radical SAM protein [Thermoplasmata archaeon]